MNRKKPVEKQIYSPPIDPKKSATEITKLLFNAYGKLSNIEKEEMKILDDYIIECQGTMALNERLLDILGPTKEKPVLKKFQVLGITMSALRCIDLIKASPILTKKKPIMKLFSKHFKLVDHLYLLKKQTVVAGYGTPSRIKALLDENAMDLDPEVLKIIIIDTQTDLKRRNVLTMNDTCKEAAQLILDHFLHVLKAGKCKLLII